MLKEIVKKEEIKFQLFFLKHDKSQGVKVVEVKEINFGEVIQHLNLGESVFITQKHVKTLNPRQRMKKEAEELWYFTHI